MSVETEVEPPSQDVPRAAADNPQGNGPLDYEKGRAPPVASEYLVGDIPQTNRDSESTMNSRGADENVAGTRDSIRDSTEHHDSSLAPEENVASTKMLPEILDSDLALTDVLSRPPEDTASYSPLGSINERSTKRFKQHHNKHVTAAVPFIRRDGHTV